ncbi:hypothetical protein PV11_06061 [Exophiala sideris]|uniref:Uncharacterized protein n=1 Tax=Exophiala sideris TaxID=1016849 RepID=A0A0D1YMI8_9EURO|nr:hypothetical protein PV11_06061 [Exophiala sideris]
MAGKCLLHWILVMAATVAVANAYPVNETSGANSTTQAPTDEIICVYSTSGQYCLLNRILFYALLVFATISQKWTWLSIGSLAYIMNFSGTAAIHAIVLVATRGGQVLDLDGLGTWCILSSVTVAVVPAIWLSERIENSQYRPLFAFWGTFVSVGSMFAAAAIAQNVGHEPSCSAILSNGRQSILTTPAQLDFLTTLNCTYTCFDAGHAMRSRGDIIAVPLSVVESKYYYLLLWSFLITLFTGFFLGLFSFCFACIRRPTRAESKSEMSRSMEWIRPSRQTQAKRRRERARKAYETGKYKKSTRGCWVVYLNLPAFLVVVIINEVYVNTSRLPKDENAFAVGQWAPWVTVSLAMIASTVNGWYSPKWEKLLKIYAEDEEAIKLEQKEKQRSDVDQTTGLLDNVQDVGSSANAQQEQPENGRRTSSPWGAASSWEAAQHHEQVDEQDIHSTQQRLISVPNGPFQIEDIQQLPVKHHPKPCEYLEYVGTDLDGTLLVDPTGKRWIVHRGVVFHRESWE